MPNKPFTKKIVAALDTVLCTMSQTARNQSIIVAASGGPDSTALLYSLAYLRKKYGFEIIAAFFDHGLFNSEYEDAELVKKITDALSIQLLTGFGDSRLFAKAHKLSPEEACRQLRYQFLAQSAYQTGSKFIALGHTEDDQTETILLNLIRGSGLNGLTGMKALSTRYDSELKTKNWLLRPLLNIKHSETLECCKENNLLTIEDQSNTHLKFKRNRIRTQVIPQLQKLNPSINQSFKKLAASLQVDYEFIMNTSNKIYQEITSECDDNLTIDKSALYTIDPALQGRILQIAFMKFTGSRTSLSFKHIQAMMELLATNEQSTLSLPRGITFYSDRQSFQLYKEDTLVLRSSPTHAMFELPIPGTVTYGQWTFNASLHQAFEQTKNLDPLKCAIVDYDAVGSSVLIRHWSPGDTFQPLGMNRSKKIQDFFVDEKVPRYKKATIPLLVNPRGIFWIAGHRIAEWAKITTSTHTALVIKT
tara:strand:- start:11184 stop:12611 length:1428 start_codon:yes stop_codon:yes gene_type:complete